MQLNKTMNFQFIPFIIDFGCLRDEFQPEGNANPFPGEKRKKSFPLLPSHQKVYCQKEPKIRRCSSFSLTEFRFSDKTTVQTLLW